MSPTAIPGNLLLKNGMVITGSQQYPAVIGEPFGGGYFAGYISHTADGNPTHALIVAPRATGATGDGYVLTNALAIKNVLSSTPGTSSVFNGKANTDAMLADTANIYPAVSFCAGLSIGGNTDWYLPSWYELEIAYFNLKPTTSANVTTVGDNPYSVPKRLYSYTANYPLQTALALFASPSGAERFSSGIHWTSTESTITNFQNKYISLDNGNSPQLNKTGQMNVRAFRRIAL